MLKYAQDFLPDTASGEACGGFNTRVLGYSFSECMDGISAPSERWGQRCAGWTLADKMIREGKIFSRIKTKNGDIEFKCFPDGDSWCCVGYGFVNLQESNNYCFGNTYIEARTSFINKGYACKPINIVEGNG